jgi:acetyl esterase/lipase
MNDSQPLTPTHADVAYGPHRRHVLDVYCAPGDGPRPLQVWIHGGGFRRGSKDGIKPEWVRLCLANGISVASVEYRVLDDAPFPAPQEDGRRAVQFLRHHAEAFGVDPGRFVGSGGSAGAGIAQWLGFHADMADPSAADPIERESTRLQCVVVDEAQTSYDPRDWKRWFGGRFHAPREDTVSGRLNIDDPEELRIREEISPINHYGPDAPPTLLFYHRVVAPLELGAETPPDHDWVHTPLFAVPLRDRARAQGNTFKVIMKPWRDPDCQTLRMAAWLEFIRTHAGA